MGLGELAHFFFHDNRDICITGYNILLKIRRILFKTELLHRWTPTCITVVKKGITIPCVRAVFSLSLSLIEKKAFFPLDM